MNKEKVIAWIESLENMANQSDRYFVERTELYKENQKKDKEIERLKEQNNNLINKNERLKEDYEKEKYLVDKYTRQITQEYKNTSYQCKEKELYKSRIDKALEIYENRNTCKYKKERFMEDKSTSDLMYEALTGGDE